MTKVAVQSSRDTLVKRERMVDLLWNSLLNYSIIFIFALILVVVCKTIGFSLSSSFHYLLDLGFYLGTVRQVKFRLYYDQIFSGKFLTIISRENLDNNSNKKTKDLLFFCNL